MEPYYQRSGITIFCGDNRDILPHIEAESISAVVSDPPSGISFMNAKWDHDKGGRDAWVAWLAGVLAECNRTMKPGAHALVWALPRTSGWTHRAIEDAGLDVRDCVSHMFGSGFPKSANVSKMIDKAAGAEREVVGRKSRTYADNPASGGRDAAHWTAGSDDVYEGGYGDSPDITAPATPEAQQWEGWHTALKPAAEFWYLARKPFRGTVAANVLAHGTGAINVDASRVGISKDVPGSVSRNSQWFGTDGETGNEGGHNPNIGRWPPNVILDEAAARDLDAMSGHLHGSGNKQDAATGPNEQYNASSYHISYAGRATRDYGTKGGGASRFMTVLPIDDPEMLRFLYQPKASRAERNRGLEGMPERVAHRYSAKGQGPLAQQTPSQGVLETNHHPTVKPLALMRWLLTLVSPPGGTILDPFAGSGSTLVAAAQLGIPAVGIEMDPEYAEIAARRIDHVLNATQQYALVMDVAD